MYPHCKSSTRGIRQLFSSDSGDFEHIFFPKKSFAWVTLDYIFFCCQVVKIYPIFLTKKLKLKLLVHVQNNKLASCKNQFYLCVNLTVTESNIFPFLSAKIAIKFFAFQMLLSFFLALKNNLRKKKQKNLLPRNNSYLWLVPRFSGLAWVQFSSTQVGSSFWTGSTPITFSQFAFAYLNWTTQPTSTVLKPELDCEWYKSLSRTTNWTKACHSYSTRTWSRLYN